MLLRVHHIWIGLFCVRSMILVIFSYSICFKMLSCVLLCFCSGSTFNIRMWQWEILVSSFFYVLPGIVSSC